MSNAACARVLIVDDHRIVRLGLRHLLEETHCRIVVGEAKSGEEALEVFDEVQPDLVLADISMGGMDGIELTKHLKSSRPDVKVLIVSMHAESLYVHQALNVGADGYVDKGNIDGVIEEATSAVLAGKQYLCESTRKLMNR